MRAQQLVTPVQRATHAPAPARGHEAARPRTAAVLWMQPMSDFTGSPAMGVARPQALSVPVCRDATRIALVLTNEHGTRPLELRRVAVRGAGAEVPLTWGGSSSPCVPAGAEATSDEVALPLARGSRLEVLIDPEPGQLVGTRGSARDRTLVDTVPAGDEDETLYYYGLRAVLAPGAAPGEAVCLFGDSLVNQGYMAGEVARRMFAARPGTLVCNCGISGNRLLRAGSGDNRWVRSFGPAGAERFLKDVTFGGTLRPRAVYVGMGVNDLYQAVGPLAGEFPRAEDLVDALERLRAEGRSVGARVVLGTIGPFRRSLSFGEQAWSPQKEAIRQEVNAHILAGPDAVDVDALVRDPLDPSRLAAAFDCGDHLHFSPDGGRTVGSAVYRALDAALGPAW